MITVVTGIGLAYFSDEDWDLAYEKWHFTKRNGYLSRKLKGERELAHKLIARRIGLVGLIDHEDRNKLNNQRTNLRSSDISKNGANANISAANTSGYKGVSQHRSKWQAKIQVCNKQIRLGEYNSPKEAALAYDVAALKYFGKFANINFPQRDN